MCDSFHPSNAFTTTTYTRTIWTLPDWKGNQDRPPFPLLLHLSILLKRVEQSRAVTGDWHLFDIYNHPSLPPSNSKPRNRSPEKKKSQRHSRRYFHPSIYMSVCLSTVGLETPAGLDRQMQKKSTRDLVVLVSMNGCGRRKVLCIIRLSRYRIECGHFLYEWGH